MRCDVFDGAALDTWPAVAVTLPVTVQHAFGEKLGNNGQFVRWGLPRSHRSLSHTKLMLLMLDLLASDKLVQLVSVLLSNIWIILLPRCSVWSLRSLWLQLKPATCVVSNTSTTISVHHAMSSLRANVFDRPLRFHSYPK